jgi:hypothetical protein
MRALKRRWKAWQAERAIKPRRTEVAEAVRVHLGLRKPPRLVERGNLGHDSNYMTYGDSGELIGVLRLVNPHKKRPEPPAGMPFRKDAPPIRLDHEWTCLSRGAASGITPEPLWRDIDAILTRYLPYEPLVVAAKQQPDKVWTWLIEASRALDRLHREVGVAHMDASLSNVIADPTHTAFAVVDFEYTPVPGLTLAQGKVYDHLRLLNASWKYIPEARRHDHGPWFAQLAEFLDEETRAADLTPLAPAIDKVLAEPEWRAAVRGLWPLSS